MIDVQNLSFTYSGYLPGLVPLPNLTIATIAVATAPLTPIFALILAAFAQNKVQGFAVMKGLGRALMIPLVAYFIIQSG